MRVFDTYCTTDEDGDPDAVGILLMQHPDEQKLDLCGKGLGADGAKFLAECLKSNTTVTEVRFVYKCARKQQEALNSDYFCHLCCLQLSLCTLYTGRSFWLCLWC